jgi:hypothetical protein
LAEEDAAAAQTDWERHRVIIAAAVAAVAGKDAHITDIRRVAASNPWALQGRRLAVQNSHNLAERRGVPRFMPERGVNR